MNYRFSAFVLILLVSGFPAQAEQPDQGIPILGVAGGLVVDPYPSGIEEIHGAAAVMIGYRKRLALSLRPTILVNARSHYFRLPLFLEIPLFGIPRHTSPGESALVVAAVGGAGVSTWDGETPNRLKPLVSGGIELSLRSIVVSGFVTAVVRENGPDLMMDLFLGYLWEF